MQRNTSATYLITEIFFATLGFKGSLWYEDLIRSKKVCVFKSISHPVSSFASCSWITGKTFFWKTVAYSWSCLTKWLALEATLQEWSYKMFLLISLLFSRCTTGSSLETRSIFQASAVQALFCLQNVCPWWFFLGSCCFYASLIETME